MQGSQILIPHPPIVPSPQSRTTPKVSLIQSKQTLFSLPQKPQKFKRRATSLQINPSSKSRKLFQKISQFHTNDRQKNLNKQKRFKPNLYKTQQIQTTKANIYVEQDEPAKIKETEPNHNFSSLIDYHFSLINKASKISSIPQIVFNKKTSLNDSIARRNEQSRNNNTCNGFKIFTEEDDKNLTNKDLREKVRNMQKGLNSSIKIIKILKERIKCLESQVYFFKAKKFVVSYQNFLKAKCNYQSQRKCQELEMEKKEFYRNQYDTCKLYPNQCAIREQCELSQEDQQKKLFLQQQQQLIRNRQSLDKIKLLQETGFINRHWAQMTKAEKKMTLTHSKSQNKERFFKINNNYIKQSDKTKTIRQMRVQLIEKEDCIVRMRNAIENQLKKIKDFELNVKNHEQELRLYRGKVIKLERKENELTRQLRVYSDYKVEVQELRHKNFSLTQQIQKIKTSYQKKLDELAQANDMRMIQYEERLYRTNSSKIKIEEYAGIIGSPTNKNKKDNINDKNTNQNFSHYNHHRNTFSKKNDLSPSNQILIDSSQRQKSHFMTQITIDGFSQISNQI